MKARHVVIVGITVLLVGALMTGVVQALDTDRQSPSAVANGRAATHTVATLENVRDYVPATGPDSVSYAIDAGRLFAGEPGAWVEIPTPHGIIANSVALDTQRPNIVYIGAANEITIYRSVDAGQTWLRVPLSETPGGVTDIAVDSVQRLIYAGTDTAGVFRLRDVGSSVVVGGQLLLDEPVRQVVTDSSGTALTFARTDNALFRAENFGLAWVTVDNLHSSPTSIAIANSDPGKVPAAVYVGTVDRGVLASTDGMTWNLSNDGLGMGPGTRMRVDALAVDPVQPNQVYAATSFLFGSTVVHQTPTRIASSTNGAAHWNMLAPEFLASVTDLLPVSRQPGAVYALTTESRSPLALFDVPSLATNVDVVPVTDAAPVAAASAPPIPRAWAIAALAALALGLAVTFEVRQRSSSPLPQTFSMAALETQTVNVIG